MSSASKAIRINKPPHLGVIIPALEVVQLRLFIVDVATVAEGVIVPQVGGGAGGCDIAPGIVGIADELLTVAVYNGGHITLQVGDVVELEAVKDHCQRNTGGIVAEVHGMPVHRHVGQLTAQIGVVVGAVRGNTGGRIGKVKGTVKLSP